MQRKTAEYIRIPHEVFYDDRITPAEVMTYAFLVSACKDAKFTRVTNNGIAGMLDVSRPSIKRYIANLKACGHIEIRYMGEYGEERRIYPQILPEY